MIKTSDFLFKYLVEKHGITDVFLVTGGGAMHLNDSIGRNPIFGIFVIIMSRPRRLQLKGIIALRANCV